MHKVLAKYLEESGKKGKKQGPEKFTLKHSMSTKAISKAANLSKYGDYHQTLEKMHRRAADTVEPDSWMHDIYNNLAKTHGSLAALHNSRSAKQQRKHYRNARDSLEGAKGAIHELVHDDDKNEAGIHTGHATALLKNAANTFPHIDDTSKDILSSIHRDVKRTGFPYTKAVLEEPETGPYAGHTSLTYHGGKVPNHRVIAEKHGAKSVHFRPSVNDPGVTTFYIPHKVNS